MNENNQGQIIETAIYDLAIHPASSDTLIIGMGEGMRRTIDGGVNWSDIYYNSSFFALAHDPDDSNHVFASGVSQDSTLFFITSQDFGINWSGLQRSPFEEDLYTKVMLSGTFDGLKILFFGTNNGLYSYVFTN